MLNEILNKREDREVWRIKEQIEIGKLKKVMHDRLPCVRLKQSCYFRNERRTSTLQRPIYAYVKKSIPEPKQELFKKRKGNVKCTELLPTDHIVHFKLEGI